MTESLNWSDLANTRLGEVEPPKIIPDGHYSAIITGIGKAENVGKNKTLIIKFPCRLNEPLADVDQEAFAASDGFRKDGYELSWWLTPASLYRFTEFAKALGASDDMGVQDAAEFLANCGEEFVVEATGVESKNGGHFIQLDNPTPLADYQEQVAQAA